MQKKFKPAPSDLETSFISKRHQLFHPYFVLLTQGQSSPLFWTMGSLYFWSYKSIVSLIKLKFVDRFFVDVLVWYKLWMLIWFRFDLQIWQNDFRCTTCTKLVNQQRIGHRIWLDWRNYGSVLYYFSCIFKVSQRI